MTREEIAAIDRECGKQHISQQEYLEKHGITRHQYYRWKRRYREEDAQSLVPAGFVPMMPRAFFCYFVDFRGILANFDRFFAISDGQRRRWATGGVAAALE